MNEWKTTESVDVYFNKIDMSSEIRSQFSLK